VLGPWVARRASVVPHVVLATGVAIAAVCGATAVVLTSTRSVSVWCAAAAAAAVATIATVGVWQWRFAPRARVRDVAMTVASAVIAALVYPPGARDGEPWSTAVLALVLVVCALVATPLARLARRVAQRIPDSRSASR
jgi:hypothetical protein